MSDDLTWQVGRCADALEKLCALLERGGGPVQESPDPDNPFSMAGEETIRRLHEVGRAAYGEQWAGIGPQLVQAATHGRTDRSGELTYNEAMRLIAQLQGQAPPAYAT